MPAAITQFASIWLCLSILYSEYSRQVSLHHTHSLTLTGHQVGTVEKALQVFEKLGLIEILDNGAIYIMDIQNFIGQSSTEADRQRQYYNRVKTERELVGGKIGEVPVLPQNTEKPEPKSNIIW